MTCEPMTDGDRRKMREQIDLWRARISALQLAHRTGYADGPFRSTVSDLRALIARYESLLAEDAQTRGTR